MYFHKIHHPYNFRALPAEFRCCGTAVQRLATDVWRIRIDRPGIQDHGIQVIRHLFGQGSEGGPGPYLGHDAGDGPDSYALAFDQQDGLRLSRLCDGTTVLHSHADLDIGTCGTAWLACFDLVQGMRMYGMGEKNIGFEKSRVRTKFWNTDVWADFHWEAIANGTTDPMYASFPVLVIKQGSTWVGMMVPTPVPAFMDTGARQVIEGAKDSSVHKELFYVGAVDGNIDLVLCASDNAASVVGMLTRLVGLPPMPPLWALGHHQSRWGYGTFLDALALDEELVRHRIPTDAIWFDIDYLDGYRVFTFGKQVLEDRERVLASLDGHGRKLVAILDPGVKADGTYAMCREGLDHDHFCVNPEGLPYVGFVWPGASYFPDFSLAPTRQWWADHTRALVDEGIDAFWVDMNDPSTGSSSLEDMLFNHGTVNHHMLHNYYGLGMAEATWEGLRLARPELRPFVLTRSAMLGSSRFGAMWTGDNMSNHHHLRKGIEMTLSLSLSTMAFTGNDTCGFGGDADDELATDWYRACMLFPFLRNHSSDGTRRQEPWTFSESALSAIRDALATRYALLPYLYNQFIRLAHTGEPIARPMVYADPDPAFELLSDQFMIGPALLQGPKLERGQTARTVVLPRGAWLGLHDGRFHGAEDGPLEVPIDLEQHPVPLFLREGEVVPLAWGVDGAPTISSTRDIDLSYPLFMLFCGSRLRGSTTYCFDGGDGYDDPSKVVVDWHVGDSTLHVTIDAPSSFRCAWAVSVAGSAVSQVAVGQMQHGQPSIVRLPRGSESTVLPGMQARFSIF